MSHTKGPRGGKQIHFGSLLVHDPDFFDSENEKNNDDDDDTLFNENVTGGIKMGCEPLQTKGTVALECEVDKLECPSSEELINEYSTDNKTKYRFPKFDAEIDMKNLQLEVGQKYRSLDRFKDTVRQTEYRFPRI
ncbi:Uncharacterized protein Adt_36300 [Abeliophyllum distichum]|uniref:Uncharacterized protein n=1 Tax=Abeliophyllum distichum TaxID=126358 RepID=A0ABD1QH54_9LAMI